MARLKKNSGPNPAPPTSSQMNIGVSKMLASHVVQMSEHVSSIQLVATKLEPDGSTTLFNFGKGDMYARAKAIETFLCMVGNNHLHE